MKQNSTLGPIVVASILALCAGQIAIAQVNWTWEDLAVEPGPPGSWDSANHQLGDIVFDGTTYHLYLVGGQTDLVWESAWAVGHWTASSLDGPWDEDPENPVLETEPWKWCQALTYDVIRSRDKRRRTRLAVSGRNDTGGSRSLRRCYSRSIVCSYRTLPT